MATQNIPSKKPGGPGYGSKSAPAPAGKGSTASKKSAKKMGKKK